MLSEDLLKQYDFDDLDTKLYWDEVKKGRDNYKHIGEISYTYIDLRPLIEN